MKQSDKTNPEVDLFFSKAIKWQAEMEQLRRIVLDCGLTEELKWKQACYTFQDSNLLLISGFKNHCVLSFFKGALLSDPQGLLEKPGENSQAARIIKFINVREIIELEPVLKAYIRETIELEKKGLKVDFKGNPEPVPEELENKLADNPALKRAFEALTPGRQRGYILYFSAPKQSKSRTARIEKYTERILAGKGFHDCVCGLSKKYPRCDGSHKSLA